MSARFAEKLIRETPLYLETEEEKVSKLNIDRPACVQCEEDIYLGFFFDGTNNNKYRDTPGNCHTNVARLYEAYAGSPTVNQLGIVKGAPKADEGPAWPKEIPSNKNNYRKTYIPGVGTPFKELGDKGENGSLLDKDKTLGLAMAKHSEVRVCWALLQVTNHLHAILAEPKPNQWKVDTTMAQKMEQGETRYTPSLGLGGIPLPVNDSPADVRSRVLKERAAELKQAIDKKQPLGRRTPKIRRIRISIFGFSRGSAKARLFLKWLLEAYGSGVAGIPLKVDFVGIFDTVASVGLAQSAPGFDGHFSWATTGNMAIPDGIRCAHLVAAHEVRGSFPLDAIGGGGLRKEIVYPGVHSDVGGGYPPKDQGRAVGGDSEKLSQIPLAQMYREALIAGVPLLLEDEFNTAARKNNFKIADSTIATFNAYVEATQNGTPATPPQNVNKNTLYPVERQPRDTLQNIMWHHQAFYLKWRHLMLGKIHQLPNLVQTSTPTREQDIQDFKKTDDDLKLELEFVRSNNPLKYTSVDDTAIDVGTSGVILIPGIGPLASAGAKAMLVKILKAKQAEWDNGIRAAWGEGTTPRVPEAASRLFSTLVHDSRAWFKPFGPDDDDWYKPGGGRDQKTAEKTARHRGAIHECQILKQRHQARLGQLKSQPGGSESAAYKQSQQSIEVLDARIAKEEQAIAAIKAQPTVIEKGHEPYKMWGYLRRRRVYHADGGVTQVTAEERNEDQLAEIAEEGKQRRAQAREYETKRYENIRRQQEQGVARVKQRYAERGMSDVDYRDYMQVSQARMKEAAADYEQAMKALSD
ncbi:T6SS phospholipase effector Tle1-like catalytic domain-containing protein [Chitinolyticbacter albus]|uniref:T6SS phospholipase effector Tle1-like catalytic domain-containing protein n=1 Tax=Chitinolyticbacter albus TaxID=2961951 RepID=UPI0021099C8E|nr:DUF2235 domain-containing protein [Chitinolyticbacter albus]